ncbi:aminoglycoside phosphotransferase family protein [Kitasatospora sp. NPDC097643]|uniref:phosphotransferase family protein n=1 Tax=Kitasatospora sp. NPDC097643 TaxID=3157230 RepID=UPI0033343EB4
MSPVEPPLFGPGLRERLGTPCRSHRIPSSPRSRVWRSQLSGAPVVIKQLVDGPDAADRYAREVAALTLASRLDPPVVPRLLDTDADERLLVLEHLEHRPPAEDWTVHYATALARLHAATADGSVEGSVDGRPEVRALPVWSPPKRRDADSFLALARALGVPVPAAVDAELDALLERLAHAPGRALLHGDPCPGNDLHTAGGVRFIDFEQASLGSPLVELAYLRIGFPTCWCVTAPAPALLARAETAYREAWRAATGTDLPAQGLGDACAGWLLRGDALVERALRDGTDHLAAVPARDWTWGTVTARQRLAHRLAAVATTARTTGEPGPALGELATTMRTAMLTHWPALRPPPRRRP